MDRYSRQNITYGELATKNLFNSKVILFGEGGYLETEIVKNLLLSGVNSIFVPKECIFSYEVNHLNPQCKISKEDDIKSVINSDKQLLIYCSKDKKEAIELNECCRNSNIKMIWACSIGASGFVFVDILNSHFIKDIDGENIDPLQIENISSSGEIEVIGDLSNVKDYDTITFKSLVGNKIDFLRDKKFKIMVKNRNTIKLSDFSDLKLLEEMDLQNGTIIVDKRTNTISHTPLGIQLDRLKSTGEGIYMNNSFNETYDRNVLISQIDFIENGSVNKVSTDENVKRLSKSFLEDVPCVSSIIGAYVSNEAIKILTNKFEPLSQWLVYSDYNLVPDDGKIFNEVFLDYIKNMSLFMVGCGAIGCEVLKNLAQLNFCTGDGKLIITDPDHIEISNLSRQLLYKNEHVKQSKSEVASKEIKKFNREMNIIALNQKMCPDNQDLLDNIFLKDKPNCVVNALDNVEARRYMDIQCFNNSIPLFESGTQGMKGNTQPVIPYLTETYSNSSDPDQEKSFPVCTIKNFPNQIQHTIHWSLDIFDFFRRAPENANKYLEDRKYLSDLNGYDKSLAKKDINFFLVDNGLITWEKCAIWAGELYLEYFRDQIIQILNSFPEDSLNNDGTLFWSKGKRCPRVLELDLTNDLVLDFIESATRLLLQCYGSVGEQELIFKREDLLSVDYNIYNYEIKDIKIAKNDSEIAEQKIEDKEIDKLTDELLELSVFGDETEFVSQVFEKDDDDNNHIKFIQAASNLRATNYGIEPISFEETKAIAGKIIPAVVTTTSIVSGLITVELMKNCYYDALNIEKKIEYYNNTFVNLATNLFISSDPVDAPKMKIAGKEFNSWTKFVEENDLTLDEFITKYNSKFGDVSISMILHNSSILYAEFMSSDEDKTKKLSSMLKDKLEIDVLSGKVVNLIIACDDDDIELPSIQLKVLKE